MPSPIERKLAAIMFTDIAGYSEQMSKDQDLAFILLEEKQSKFKPLIKEHNGTLIKEMGDGTLSQYPTAVDASKCSVELQKLIQDNDKLNVRVGIHLGDTLFKDGDVFGDGVNIASRLESMSPAGGILVSKNVYDELLSRQGFEGISLGLQSLKGVGRLVEVYALKDAHLTVPNPDDYIDTKIDVHTDDEVPSIAIIPFDNKGADEDVFYAYGISADLISDCSGAGLIRVASLSDIEKLDYTNLDNTELSKKLLVRYISQGTLWKMGDMFQLSVELYDTKENKIVWSDRWQEKWDDLPTIKGNLSDGLLKALDTKPKVEKKVETANPEAYEFYLKAKHKYEKRENTDDTEIARGLLSKAIELDDNLISAKVLLGLTYFDMGDYDKAMVIYTPTLSQATELGDKYGIVSSLIHIGNLYIFRGEFDKAIDYAKKSLKIQKELGDKFNMAKSLNVFADAYHYKGDKEKALNYSERALVIQKQLDAKRGMGSTLGNIGGKFIEKGDYDNALVYIEKALAIDEEVGDKEGIGKRLGGIGVIYWKKGDYDKSNEYQKKSFSILEELGDKHGIANSLFNFGYHYFFIGEFEKALSYYNRALEIVEEIGDKYEKADNLHHIGIVYLAKGDYKQAEVYLKKSLTLQKEIKLSGKMTTRYLYLTYKNLGKGYDKNNIHKLFKENDNLNYRENYINYQLTENTSYIETAYKQVQEEVNKMEEKFKTKFLSYPIPKAIVEEWEKVK